MRRPILRSDDLPWQEKIIPAVSPERRGFCKILSERHGLTQFEARLTRIPPGETNTWHHRHTVIEEWFYVLRGSCHVHLDGAWHEVREGDSIATGPEDLHLFRNFGTADCDLVMVGIVHPDDSALRQPHEPPPPPGCAPAPAPAAATAPSGPAAEPPPPAAP